MADQTNESLEVDFDASKQSNVKVLNLSKAQLRALGINYKAPQTAAQLERNKKLSEMAKQRHEAARRQKAEYEQQQAQMIYPKATLKPKQKYHQQTFPIEIEENSDDERMMQEYKEFQKFKASKQRPADVKPKKKISVEEKEPGQARHGYAEPESSDDERIQKKAEKATKVIEAVDKLNNAINKMAPPTNPYLDLFNRKK
jgi:hypothetical protein